LRKRKLEGTVKKGEEAKREGGNVKTQRGEQEEFRSESGL
jgi:hypothetical protein